MSPPFGWAGDDVNKKCVVPEAGFEPACSYEQGILCPINTFIINN